VAAVVLAEIPLLPAGVRRLWQPRHAEPA
jgi:hypothetical protein